MLPIGEIKKEEDVEFCWCEKKVVGGVNGDVQFYESFKYDGITYFLYDSVYVWCGDETEPSIGKLVKMWETPSHKNKVKIVWYFRPCEIKNILKDDKQLEKEIFLACGQGKGLFNIVSPEAIAGKCKVICMASDERNPQVSSEELRTANHIFFRTFDVGKCKLSERFPDEIAGLEVVQYFNRENDRNLRGAELEEKKGKVIVRLKGLPVVGNLIKNELKLEEASLDKGTCIGAEGTNGPFSRKELDCPTDLRPIKKRKVHFNLVSEEPPKGWPSPEKREKFTDTYPAEEEHGKGSKICTKSIMVTRRPEEETSKWFKQQPWKVKMQRANETGALVLLENLDPTYTSSEIEDMVWNALNKNVDAKMVQLSTNSTPHNGKAVVVFKSKDAADAALHELTKKCLVLEDGRPIVASRGYPKNLGDGTKFHGHLIIDRIRHQKQQEQMRAVSTSHYSQPNTIEHELALEWRSLQEKSTLWWNELNEQHRKEIEELKSKLKTQNDEQGLHHDI